MAGLHAELCLILRIDARAVLRRVVQHLVEQRAAVDADGEPADRSAARVEVADLAHRDVFARRRFVVRLFRVVEPRGYVQFADDRARLEDVELLAQLIHQQRVLVRGLHLEQDALFDVALHLFRVPGFHVFVVRLRAVVGIGLDQHIAVAVRVLLQHVHALTLPVQLARAVLLIGLLVRAGGEGRVDVLGLLHVHHRNRLHHQIPDGLLVVGVGQVVFVRVHVPVARRLRYGALARFARQLGGRLSLVPDLRFFDPLVPNQRVLNVEAAQIQHLRRVGIRRFAHFSRFRRTDGQRQQALLALLAPVVAKPNGHGVCTVRRRASVRQNAVPDQPPASRVHLRRAQLDTFAVCAAQRHRQRAALRRLKGERPFTAGAQAVALRRHVRQLRRGQRAGRRRNQQKKYK